MPEPSQQQQPDLAAIGSPIAAVLLAGWTVTWSWATAAELAESIPGALAICDPTPTRSMAAVRCVWPWPAHESLEETIAHELTHAALSQLVALIPSSDAAIMLEEQAVERIGKAISGAPARLRVPMGRALLAARARISARTVRARGGTMDPKLLTEALDAIEAGDAAKAIEILKGLIVAAASNGAPPPSEPSGETMPNPGDAKVEAPAVPQDGALQGADDSKALQRARLEAVAFRDELNAMVAAQRPAAKEAIVTGLRARLGAALTPAIEARIMAAKTFPEAQTIAAIAEEMVPAAAQRARSGVQIEAANLGEKGVPETDLLKEGFSPVFVKAYRSELKRDPIAADVLLGGARARLSMPQNGAAR